MAKDLIFVDVETTGLDDRNDSVIQVGAIRTDSTGRNVKTRLDIKVKPTTPVSPEAARVNGYTEEGWADASEPYAAALLLASVAQGAEFAGHCVWFDQGFCRQLLERNNVKVPWGHRLVDTQTLAHLLRAQYPSMRGTNLDSCIEVMGGEKRGSHDALEDAEWARRLYVHVRGQFEASENEAAVG